MIKSRRLFVVVFLAAIVLAAAGTASADFIAYDRTATTGDQAWAGPLGMDFRVLTPIVISELGVFVDQKRDAAGALVQQIVSDLTVSVYQLTSDTTGTLLASLEFTTEDPGHALGLGAYRFEELDGGLYLAPGLYTIVARGFGPNLNFNRNSQGGVNVGQVMANGGGAIALVGISRYGDASAVFPNIPDYWYGGGPENRYDAGTFEYSVVPEPATLSLLCLGLAGVARAARRRKQ